MRLCICLCFIFLTGCETVTGLLPEADATKPAPQESAASANSDSITPVRSTKELASFEIENKSYAEEDQDFGTPPVSGLINPAYHGATPTTLAGGKLISTYELLNVLSGKSETNAIVINALQGSATELVADSIWLSGAGAAGRFNDETQTRLAQHLDTLTNGDDKKTLIFYCLDLNCWHSYNAALRAVVARYRNVLWYRGGLRAWYEAGLPTDKSQDDSW